MKLKVSALDNVFFQMESHDTPMHVAGLQTFQLPEGASDDFVQDLVTKLRSTSQLQSPWNLKLKQRRLNRQWELDHDVDLDYHIRHIALPRPGGERELGVMISSLHGHRLRRHRPLWECYVIEGLADNRFAIYTKIHHALADGVRAMSLMTAGLANTPEAPLRAPWAAANISDTQATSIDAASPKNTLANILKDQSSALSGVSKAVAHMLIQALKRNGHLTLPFTAPASILNSRITGQRRYATQQIDIARLKAIGRATGSTLNDVMLALCGGALRRFLKDANQLPNRSLVASIPVSVRAAGDSTSSNAVSIILAELGTHIANPLERLSYICKTTKEGKEHLRAIPSAGQQLYNSLLMSPFVIQAATGLAARSHPYFNITVSNVPGPSDALYLNGAQMEAMYPVSIPTHGQALNITCSSYNGSLNIGFCGCRDALPHLQRLAVYFGDAMTELEAAIALRPIASNPARLRQTKAA